MIKIFNKTTNEFLGRVAEGDLQFLVDHLEEDRLQDNDYFLCKETIDSFESAGASPRLLEVLRGGLRSDENIEIRWEKDSLDTAS